MSGCFTAEHLAVSFTNHMLGISTYSPPSNVYACLHNGPFQDPYAAPTELTSRELVTFTTVGDVFPCVAFNTNVIEFYQNSVSMSGGAISFYDSASGGNRLFTGNCSCNANGTYYWRVPKHVLTVHQSLQGWTGIPAQAFYNGMWNLLLHGTAYDPSTTLHLGLLEDSDPHRGWIGNYTEVSDAGYARIDVSGGTTDWTTATEGGNITSNEATNKSSYTFGPFTGSGDGMGLALFLSGTEGVKDLIAIGGGSNDPFGPGDQITFPIGSIQIAYDRVY